MPKLRTLLSAVLLLVASIFVASIAITGQAPTTRAAGDMLVYVGTYTGEKSKGIYVSHMDVATGKLTAPELAGLPLELSADGSELVYTFDAQSEQTGIGELLRKLNEHGIDFKDLQSSQSSLEEIFVNLVKADA